MTMAPSRVDRIMPDAATTIASSHTGHLVGVIVTGTDANPSPSPDAAPKTWGNGTAGRRGLETCRTVYGVTPTLT